MDPTMWSRRFICAQLIVAIWIAFIGATPSDRHADEAVEMPTAEQTPGGHVVGAKTDAAGIGTELRDHLDVLLEEVGDCRLANHDVDAGADLVKHLLGVVALVVQADSCRGQHGEAGPACHGRSRRRACGWPCHLDDLEHLRVTVGDELGHGLPDAEAVVPLLGYLVDLRPEAEPDVRSRAPCTAPCRARPRRSSSGWLPPPKGFADALEPGDGDRSGPALR